MVGLGWVGTLSDFATLLGHSTTKRLPTPGTEYGSETLLCQRATHQSSRSGSRPVRGQIICLFSSYQLNAHILYSIIIYMLHYNPQHVSSSTVLIFRRTNCIITASGIVTLCKRPYSMPVESGLSGVSSSGGQIVLLQPLVSSRSVNGRTVCRLRVDCIPLSTGILYGRLQRVTIPEAVITQYVLLKMSKVLLETCRGL